MVRSSGYRTAVEVIRYAAPFVVFLVFAALLRRRAARGATAPGDLEVPSAGAHRRVSRFSATHLRFYAAWAIGFVSIPWAGVNEAFLMPLALAGALLVWAGVVLARDPEEW